MRAALLQHDIAWEDPAANFARVESLLAADPPAPGALLVLPETFATGFSMDAARCEEGPAGEQSAFLASLARRLACTVLGGVLARDPRGRPANVARAFGPGGEPLAWFAKLHGFSPAGESAVYAPGDGPVVFPWGPFRVAPLLCYDLRFPEAFRAAVDLGADVLVVPANWPARRERHWLALLVARAIENQAYVLGVNRVGSDPNATYSGRSVVVDPTGVVVADAGEQARVLHATLDAGLLASWRRDFPALRDRRPIGPAASAAAP